MDDLTPEYIAATEQRLVELEAQLVPIADELIAMMGEMMRRAGVPQSELTAVSTLIPQSDTIELK